jgi:hypothetical protein
MDPAHVVGQKKSICVHPRSSAVSRLSKHLSLSPREEPVGERGIPKIEFLLSCLLRREEESIPPTSNPYFNGSGAFPC